MAENLHEPCSFSYCFVNSKGDLIKEESCTVPGGQAAVIFLKKLLDMEEQILDHISLNRPMNPLTVDQLKRKKEQTKCYHCHKALIGPKCIAGESSDYDVMDHDHYWFVLPIYNFFQNVAS